MRTFLLSLVLCFVVSFVKSQPATIDSLSNELHKTSNDTLRLVLFSRLGDAHMEVNMDSALFYARQYLGMSQKLNYTLNEADALQQMAEYLLELASSGNGLELSFKALQLLEDNQYRKNVLPSEYLEMLHVPKTLHPYPQYRLYIIGKINNMIGMTYSINDNTKALPYILKALEIAKSLHAEDLLIVSYEGLVRFSKPDSALIYLKKSYQLSLQTGNKKHIAEIFGGMVNAYHAMGEHVSELNTLRAALEFTVKEKRIYRVGWGYLVLANIFFTETKKKDSAIVLAMKALQIAQDDHFPYIELYASGLLSEMYKAKNMKDSAFKYLEIKVAASERTSGEEKIRQLQNADFTHQLQQNAIEAAKVKYRNRVKTYSLLGGLCVFLLLAIFLWRYNKQRQKAFTLLQKQKEKTEQALQELKSTQSQLIQSEKMASLGELTAGIAHEIQNPLNFVNNFSEVNSELIVEAGKELDNGNINEVKTILNDINDNEQKIKHHGKRADAIVKSMQQHSRLNTGQKEPTDINALADEYLRLSYHGVRAKDKTFNATIQTDFDQSLQKINIIPQDIGRVLVNVINNAFYAAPLPPEGGFKDPNYKHEPTVCVSTKKVGDKVLISVRDNGPGISQKNLDKIFQPFFTTKPAGQGTGLGLSLSYDIIKAHDGEIKVETKDGGGSEFVIQLPIK